MIEARNRSQTTTGGNNTIMPRPISNEKRAAIIKHKQAGKQRRDIKMVVCVRTVKRVWDKFNTSGSYEAAPQNSGRKPCVSEETMNAIVARIKEMPDVTLRELIEEFKLQISESALCKRLAKLRLTYKKRRFIQKRSNAKTSFSPALNGKKVKKINTASAYWLDESSVLTRQSNKRF